MNRNKQADQLPLGGIRQPRALAFAAWAAVGLGSLLLLAGIGPLLPSEATESAPTSIGQAIGFLVLGGGLLGVGVWAVRYYKNTYIVLLDHEILQRTASKRIKRIPYSSVAYLEEFQTKWGPVVRITAADGTVIRSDALNLDVARLKREVARFK